MAIADRNGLPIAVWTGSASPHEVTLVEATLDSRFIEEQPQRLIGDKAYDSDKLDARLKAERDIELIAPHRLVRNRKEATHPGRKATEAIPSALESRKAVRLVSQLPAHRHAL